MVFPLPFLSWVRKKRLNLEDDKGQIYITEGLENTFKPVDLGTEQEIQVIRR